MSGRSFYRLLFYMTDVPIPPDTGDFRLMNRQVVDALLAMPEQHRFIRGMVAWARFRQVALEYRRDERFAGGTKYPVHKMLTFAMDAITGFSIMPLRISLYAALLFIGFTALLIIVAFFAWLYEGTVPGWTRNSSVC